MSTRVFVSQPMRGKSELGIDQVRASIFNWAPFALKIYDMIEIPRLSRWQSESNPAVFNLGHSLQNMSRANLVIFAPGWQDARGCVVENTVCREYGIPFIELGEKTSAGYTISYDGRF